MSKMVMAVLMVLVGLALIAGGAMSLGTLYGTGISLIIAGILVIIATIVMAMGCKKEKAMAK